MMMTRTKHQPYPALLHALRSYARPTRIAISRSTLPDKSPPYCEVPCNQILWLSPRYGGNHTNDHKALKDFIRRLTLNGYIQEYIAYHQRAQHNALDKGHTSKGTPTHMVPCATIFSQHKLWTGSIDIQDKMLSLLSMRSIKYRVFQTSLSKLFLKIFSTSCHRGDILFIAPLDTH